MAIGPVFVSLTPKQKQVLDFIKDFVQKNDYAPSKQEIADYFGIDPPSCSGTAEVTLTVRVSFSGLDSSEEEAFSHVESYLGDCITASSNDYGSSFNGEIDDYDVYSVDVDDINVEKDESE